MVVMTRTILAGSISLMFIAGYCVQSILSRRSSVATRIDCKQSTTLVLDITLYIF